MVFSKLLVERFKTKMENKKSDLKVISGMRTCDGVTTSSSKFSNQSTPPQDSLTHDLTSQATSMQTQGTFTQSETSETDFTQTSSSQMVTSQPTKSTQQLSLVSWSPLKQHQHTNHIQLQQILKQIPMKELLFEIRTP